MTLALQTKKGAPFEFLEYQLCEKFHCLPTDLAKQSWDKIDLFISMMDIENQFEKRDQRLLEQKHKKPYGGR